MSVPKNVIGASSSSPTIFTTRLVGGIPKLLVWINGEYVTIGDAGLHVSSSELLGELQSGGLYSGSPTSPSGAASPSSLAYNGKSFVPVLDTMAFTDPQTSPAPVPPIVVPGAVPTAQSSITNSIINALSSVRSSLVTIFTDSTQSLSDPSGNVRATINDGFNKGFAEAVILVDTLAVGWAIVEGFGATETAIELALEAAAFSQAVVVMVQRATVFISENNLQAAQAIINQLEEQYPNSEGVSQLQQLLSEWSPSDLAGQEAYTELISQMNQIVETARLGVEAAWDKAIIGDDIFPGSLIGPAGTLLSASQQIRNFLSSTSGNLNTSQSGALGASASSFNSSQLADALAAAAMNISRVVTMSSQGNLAASVTYAKVVVAAMTAVVNYSAIAGASTTNTAAMTFFNASETDALATKAAILSYIDAVLSGNDAAAVTDLSNAIEFLTDSINDLFSAITTLTTSFQPIQVTPTGFRPFDSPQVITLKTPTKAGSTLLLFASPCGDISIAPTDDQNNTWQQINTGGDWIDWVGHEGSATSAIDQIYYAQNVKAGTTTITLNVVGTVTYLDVLVLECSGLGALDKAYPTSSDNAAWWPPPNGTGSGFYAGILPITTAQNNEIIISWWYAYPQGANPGFQLGTESTLIYDSTTDHGDTDPALVYNWMLGFQAAPVAGDYTSTTVSSADPMESVAFSLSE